MPRGILWVASQILDSEKLPEEKFSDWYENMHVQQVLSLPGSPSAVRYQALEPQPVPDAYTVEVPWLVVYELPDLEFRNSDDFTQFAIRNPPSKFEIDDIYQHSRFFIRFYEEKQVVEAPGEQKGPVTFFVSSALQPPSDPESLASFDSWYRDEHLPAMSRMAGFVRSRRYEIASTYKLEKLQPTDLMDQVPKYLALHEFSGETLPWDAFKESLSTEWSKKVLGSLEKKETGWYKVKRVYPESEWGHVGKVAEP